MEMVQLEINSNGNTISTVEKYEDDMEECRCCRPNYEKKSPEELKKYFYRMRIGGIILVTLSFIVTGVIIGSICGIHPNNCNAGGTTVIGIMSLFSILPGGIILILIANKNINKYK